MFFFELFHMLFLYFPFFGGFATSWMYVPRGFEIIFVERKNHIFCDISGVLTPTCDPTFTCDQQLQSLYLRACIHLRTHVTPFVTCDPQS